MVIKLTVRKCLAEESNSGWVWLPEIEGIKSRDYISITNYSDSNIHKIYCIYRKLDKSYKNAYKERIEKREENQGELSDNTIVISEYYRDKLKIDFNSDKQPELDIQKINTYDYCSKIKATIRHPDNTVRIAVCLAIVSAIIGITSIFLAIISILITIKFGILGLID